VRLSSSSEVGQKAHVASCANPLLRLVRQRFNVQQQLSGYGTSSNPTQNTVSFSGPGQARPTQAGSTSVSADQDGIRREVQGGVCTITNFSIGGYVYAQNQCGSVLVPLQDGNWTVAASYKRKRHRRHEPVQRPGGSVVPEAGRT
jgi:hypothetical protein